MGDSGSGMETLYPERRNNGMMEEWKKKNTEDTRLRPGYGAARKTGDGLKTFNTKARNLENTKKSISFFRAFGFSCFRGWSYVLFLR
jgi:hypothetical protein